MRLIQSNNISVKFRFEYPQCKYLIVLKNMFVTCDSTLQ